MNLLFEGDDEEVNELDFVSENSNQTLDRLFFFHQVVAEPVRNVDF